MAITQDQADQFCSTLKSFHDSLSENEKQVLEQVLDQAAGSGQEKASATGRPFFERFLTLNPGKGGSMVTLKFPSDNDEGDDAY
jgi:hypothetical protein